MRTVMALIVSFAFAAVGMADVNVLIIGSRKDTVEGRRVSGRSQAFSPVDVRAELEKILAGAGLGKVNVVLEDRSVVVGTDAELEAQIDARLEHMKNIYKKYYKNRKPPEYTPAARLKMIKSMRSRGAPCCNLAAWFHWPYPADIETTTRWPNLRGEKGTKWDYIVLIGDPYTIEYMPGLYTHGVAKVAEEVAKGSAKIILLMPWPGKGSESTVDHYKEVVYRTGRSGGLMVAPAGLAWQAAGKPTGAAHPSKDGAYIAAASIFSRIWQKSAAVSTYTYKAGLADKVYKTVKSNVGATQYTGKFDFQSPFRMFGIKDRVVRPMKSGGGTSTEDDLTGRSNEALARSGVVNGRGPAYTIGRATHQPKGRKDYRNRGGRAFGYYYQIEPNSADPHLANIVSMEMSMASRMIKESNEHRVLPRRLLLGGLLQYNPKMRIKYGPHVYGPQATAMATYMYTIFSGRCPMDPKPDKVDEQWNAQKVGYETAWRVATCQVRAPGFKVMPSNRLRYTVDPEGPETMTVQFLMPPKKTVTVAVSTDNAKVATVSPKSLTFTPSNYNVPQKVTVNVAASAAPGTKFKVGYATRSDDEVYDDLSDTWEYHVNTHPVADALKTAAFSGKTNPIILTGSDVDKEVLSYSVVSKPTNGSLVISSTGVAAYTPKGGYTGTDSFTFRSNDGVVYSEPATVTVTVSKPSLYDFNLLDNASAELAPFTKYKWVETKGKWKQSTGSTDGVYTFGVADGNHAELVQDIDVSKYSSAIKSGKQSFKIYGALDKSNDDVRGIVEFLDSAKKVLLSCDSTDMMAKGKNRAALKPFEATKTAPVQTTSIRFRLVSINKRGRGNGGRFDGLKLLALDPNAAPVAANPRAPRKEK